MNIEEKMNIFHTSCQNLLEQEMTDLTKKIDQEIENQIMNEIQEYEEKEEVGYQKKLEKMEKEYNKEIYSFELESKKEILEAKKATQKDLKKEVMQLLKDFTKTSQYEEYFMKRIDEVTKKLKDTNHSVLGIVKQDEEKYGGKIRNQYKINIKIIDDKYIGGCILEDNVAGISIDHTIQNSIQEKLD